MAGHGSESPPSRGAAESSMQTDSGADAERLGKVNMLTDTQKKAVEQMVADGYLNAGQIAKQLGLLKEYVDAYMQNRG